jgi:spermidine/putrescine transport system substrate-binding protein
MGVEIDSWRAMHDPKYTGKIIMFDSVRDTIGVTLKMLGFSMNSTNPDELEQVKQVLIAQKPLLHSYTVDGYEDPLLAGDALLAMAWSGDAFKVISENDGFKYVLPKEGTNVWVDSMSVPKTAKHKEEAYKFINFILKPEIGAQLAEYLGYSTPNKAAQELLPEEVRTNKVIYPDGNVFDGNDVQIDIKDATELYDRIWTEIKSN